jgi:hypothetical protein
MRDTGRPTLRLRQRAAGALRVQAPRKRRQDTGGLAADPPRGRVAAASRALVLTQDVGTWG